MDVLSRYFDLFVVPNYHIFTAAEIAVASAFREMNGDKPEAANRWALAAAMNTSVPAYHMADAMFDERPNWPAWLQNSVTKVSELRRAVERRHCRMLRGHEPVDDLTLLGAVVDAYKHTRLRDKRRPVSSSRATVVTATGYGELGYGEGNYGGIDQVIVRTNSGQSRALSSVLQNVIDMWRLVLDRSLEPMGS